MTKIIDVIKYPQYYIDYEFTLAYINKSGKCIVYRTFNTTFTFDNYLISLPRKPITIFTKLQKKVVDIDWL